MIWVLGAIAGFLCHSPQSSLSDYYRNIHLFFLKGKSGSELDNSEQQRKVFEQMKADKDWLGCLFFYNYANYCRSQEKRTPKFQRFFQLYNEAQTAEASQQEMREQVRQSFLEGSRPLMKYTNVLTFNTRAICIYITALLNCPWVYFLFEIIVLSILYVHMHRKHETLCEKLSNQFVMHQHNS